MKIEERRRKVDRKVKKRSEGGRIEDDKGKEKRRENEGTEGNRR